MSDESDDGADVLYSQLINQLRDSSNHCITVRFRAFRTDRQVAAAAQALHQNEGINNFHFDFGCDSNGNDERNGDLFLNWGPLLQEIATREKLERAEIWQPPRTGFLLPLFRDQFFQALQRNTHIRVLEFNESRFGSSNSTSGIVSFLEAAPPALRDLQFFFLGIGGSHRDTLQSMAAAIARSSGIQTILLFSCEPAFVCPIFQSLSSPTNTSGVRKLVYGAGLEESVAADMQHYLESPSATIHCLALQLVDFDSVSSRILLGLSRNTSVNELTFSDCSIGEHFHFGEDLEHEDAQLFANFLRSNSNLTTLRFDGCNFFGYSIIVDAIATHITRRESALRCLDITTEISITAFRAMLTALSNSTQMESLIIQKIKVDRAGYLLALKDELPSFKIKELTLQFWEAEAAPHQFDPILEGVKRNYSIQNVHCNIRSTEAQKSRLEFYMNRNRKLAQWVVNPTMVPRELWCYAVGLALKAGIDSLHQSLLALSGEEVGLKQKGRKRKQPDNYKPV